jgi:hypothetical protein
MAATVRKKLYFDVAISSALTRAFFPCTQFTPGYTGDRYGGVLAALEACTGGAPNATKVQRAVSAWFVKAGDSQAGQTITSNGSIMAVDFVQPTQTVVTTVAVTRIVYLNPGNTANTAKPGQDAIYGTLGSLRHFSVRLRRPSAGGNAAAVSIRGTLYVARQHSIEV